MKKITPLLTLLLLAACAGEGPGPLGGETTPPAAEADADPANPTGLDTEVDTVETTTLDDPAAGNDTETTTPAPEAPAATPETTPAPTPEPAPAPEPEPTPEPEPAPAPAPDAAGDGRLGTTVASIGAADEPGFWIRTPLVSEQASGRLFYPASGRTVQVQLIPSGGGASGGGSQVSLAALRLLDAPLDGQPELVVYRN